jgi:hypothetical protein
MKNNNGFKPSSCPNKKCICCSPSPLTLSPKVIKNLTVQFCEMAEEDISNEALMHKRKKIGPVAKKISDDQDGPTGRQARTDDDE